jgi:hypothetical protein
MFDQILQLVKDHIGNDPQIAQHIPPEQTEAVHQEIAEHITNGLQNQAPVQGGIGGLLSQFTSSLESGSPITSAIAGGLVGSLGSKFGLGPAATGAIAAALPGLLQRFAHQTSTSEQGLNIGNITQGLGGRTGGF